MSAFSSSAISLLRQRYSPVPIRQNAKLPLIAGWHMLKTRPTSERGRIPNSASLPTRLRSGWVTCMKAHARPRMLILTGLKGEQ